MSTPFRLVRCPHVAIGHGRCALCLGPYECVGGGWALGGEVYRQGHLCLECVAGGPPWAAGTLRRRAARARRLAERCRPALWAWRWAGLHQILLDYAGALDRLADRAEALTAWGRAPPPPDCPAFPRPHIPVLATV
jgi:hypothetical protein